jgi:hypothetical protein
MSGQTFVATPPGPGAVRVDRRAAIRYPCELDASFCLPSEDEDLHWPAQVQDISAVGLGLIAHRSFAVGDDLAVELHSDDGSLSYSLLARVEWAAPLTGGVWWLGCAFARPLGDDEVQNLL